MAFFPLSPFPLRSKGERGRVLHFDIESTVKEETLYLESNFSFPTLSLGNFNKDVRRVEEQEEAKQ